jgi:hypothetical protein
MNETTPRPAAHLPSLFLTLISGIGVLVGLAGAVVAGLAALRQPGAEIGTLAWAALLLALLNLPALIYSLPRMFGRPASAWQVTDGWRLASIALGFWLIDLAVASFLVNRPHSAGSIFLPPLSLLAVGIPLWWLIELGRRGLRSTPQRTWGVASASLVGTIPLVIVVELAGFVVLGILILAWLVGSSPGLLYQLQSLAQSMMRGAVGTDRMLAILQPYLERPGVILAGVIVLSVFTPLIEEFFKPLALWFIPGHNLSEAEGFTLGMVAGGIFALLETLGTLPALNGRDGLWLMLILTRAGTGLLHITCSGLVGWGLAAAWHKGRYLRLGGLYLLAVAAHGSWNLLAQLMSMSGMMADDTLVSILGRIAPYLMGVLVAVMLVVLAGLNRHLLAIQLADQQQAAAQFAGLAGLSPAPELTIQPADPVSGEPAQSQPASENPGPDPDPQER